MKDGAHTHASSSGGQGMAVAIGAGVVLVCGLASTVGWLLPALVIGAAVLAGVQLAGVIIRAVMTCQWPSQPSYREVPGAMYPVQLTDADPGGREIAALRQAVAELHARLAAAPGDLLGPARHEHLHFHGLAAEQVAAVLAARQQARPPDGGEW